MVRLACVGVGLLLGASAGLAMPPLIEVEGGVTDGWSASLSVDGSPLGVSGTRVSTTDEFTITGDTGDDVNAIRILADFNADIPNIQGGGSTANWSANAQLIVDRLFCPGCVPVTSGTASIGGSGRIEIRLREWVDGQYRWDLDDHTGNGAIPIDLATISGRFSRESATGPEPSLPLTFGFFQDRTFAPGVYVAEFTYNSSGDVNLSWPSGTTRRSVSYAVLATLAVDEILDPPASYDRDGDGVVSADDLCLFLADPTDLTGDGVIDQTDNDEFYMTLDVILGGVPDADGDGIPDACDPDCFADCDNDGTVNIDDVDCFVAGFLAGDLGVADCDGNGTVNIDDIDCFVASFLGGCP